MDLNSEDRYKLERVCSFIEDGWYDIVWETSEQPSDDRAAWIEKFVIKPIQEKICKEFGHRVERDQCGLPEHDYCLHCGKGFPGKVGETVYE